LVLTAAGVGEGLEAGVGLVAEAAGVGVVAGRGRSGDAVSWASASWLNDVLKSVSAMSKKREKCVAVVA
jgi:hypothetical protein